MSVCKTWFKSRVILQGPYLLPVLALQALSQYELCEMQLRTERTKRELNHSCLQFPMPRATLASGKTFKCHS